MSGHSLYRGPGLYHDMPAATYDADPCDVPSLSSSIARLLLAETPKHAQYAHPRLTLGGKRKVTAEMDLGSVTHEILLGKGHGFEVCPFDDYKTVKAREWRNDVTARGKIPIKDDALEAAIAIAEAVRDAVAEIPGAERAINVGEAEAVAIWRDELGPMCRARIDWLDRHGGAIYDLKTTGTGLSDRVLNAKIFSELWALDMRAAFYLRGVEQLIPSTAGRFAYRWIFVESKEPFEARVFEMDELTRIDGDSKAAAAIIKWRECITKNCWPGYPRRIERPDRPPWAIEEMHL